MSATEAEPAADKPVAVDGPAPDSASVGGANVPPEETTARVKVEGLDESDKTAAVELPAGYESLLDRSKSWEDLGLPQALLEAVRAEGWTAPSKIQAVSIPICLTPERPNLVGQAIGGSGKTGAFALVSLMKLDVNINQPQVVIIEPTRLLAAQQCAVIQKLASRMPGVRVRYLVGGTQQPEMQVNAPLTEHIIIGTDQKLADLLKRRYLDPSMVHTYVLDEADELLTPQRAQFVVGVLGQAFNGTGKCQVLLFSASFNCLEATAPPGIKSATNALLGRRPRHQIKVKSSELMNPNLHHFDVLIETGTDDRANKQHTFPAKVNYLSQVLGAVSGLRTLIFVETNADAWRLQDELRASGSSVDACVIAGQKRGATKDRPDPVGEDVNRKTLQDFQKGVYNVCISTDALGRGIDIPGLNVVVNFNQPMSREAVGRPNLESFQHRCARVGRLVQTASGSGVCIHMVETATEFRLLREFKRYFGFETRPLPQDPMQGAEAIDEAQRSAATRAVEQTVSQGAFELHEGVGEFVGGGGGRGQGGGGRGGHGGGRGGGHHQGGGHGHGHNMGAMGMGQGPMGQGGMPFYPQQGPGGYAMGQHDFRGGPGPVPMQGGYSGPGQQQYQQGYANFAPYPPQGGQQGMGMPQGQFQFGAGMPPGGYQFGAPQHGGPGRR